MKKINYCIIGGQYAGFNHGGAETLHGAKLTAAKNDEYWDNWQGWHRPAIYAAKDCEQAENFYGEQMLPKSGAVPVMVWNGKRWEAPTA